MGFTSKKWVYLLDLGIVQIPSDSRLGKCNSSYIAPYLGSRPFLYNAKQFRALFLLMICKLQEMVRAF